MRLFSAPRTVNRGGDVCWFTITSIRGSLYIYINLDTVFEHMNVGRRQDRDASF